MNVVKISKADSELRPCKSSGTVRKAFDLHKYFH